MGNDRKCRIPDKWWWQAMGNEKQWGMTDNKDSDNGEWKTMEMAYNGEWHTVVNDK